MSAFGHYLAAVRFYEAGKSQEGIARSAPIDPPVEDRLQRAEELFEAYIAERFGIAPDA